MRYPHRTYSPTRSTGTADSSSNTNEAETILDIRTRLSALGQQYLEKVRRVVGLRYYHELDLPLDIADRIIRGTGAQEWFIWSIRDRARRGEAVAAMEWIAKNVDRRTAILETGCGCGANLIWLCQHGFVSLAGTDASPHAIAAATGLVNLARLPIEVAVDDGLNPKLAIPKVGLLLALNWLYYAPQFDLSNFLSSYRTALQPSGFVVFDMVDAAFNHMPDNQYRTDDWHLPQGARRSTQYKIRLSQDDVRGASNTAGFDIVSIFPGTEIPPRLVWVLKLRS
jgi:hypothetical protein